MQPPARPRIHSKMFLSFSFYALLCSLVVVSEAYCGFQQISQNIYNLTSQCLLKPYENHKNHHYLLLKTFIYKSGTMDCWD